MRLRLWLVSLRLLNHSYVFPLILFKRFTDLLKITYLNNVVMPDRWLVNYVLVECSGQVCRLQWAGEGGVMYEGLDSYFYIYMPCMSICTTFTLICYIVWYINIEWISVLEILGLSFHPESWLLTLTLLSRQYHSVYAIVPELYQSYSLFTGLGYGYVPASEYVPTQELAPPESVSSNYENHVVQDKCTAKPQPAVMWNREKMKASSLPISSNESHARHMVL